MSFHNVRFPTRISYGAVGGPRFSTTVQTLNSGYEQRNINWADARREYQFDVSPARQTSWDELLAFFHARRGRAYGFRLKDFADYKLVQGMIGTGDGNKQVFQVVKQYGDLHSYSRKLTRLVSGTISVFLDKAAQFGGWSVDVNTGLITFTTPPADGVEIKMSTEFDVPVRFDTDLMEAAFTGPDIHNWQQVKLVEVKE